MKDFRELKVWERSHKLTLKIYKITSNFPREEMYSKEDADIIFSEAKS